MTIQVRNTKQKEAIRSAFLAADRPLSHDEVLEAAQKKVEGLSIATVYRNVNALLEEAWLVTVEIPGSTSRYEIAGKEHHHHFKCTKCSKLYELQGCNVQIKPNLPTGFHVTGHEFFLYGLCSICV